MGQRKSVGTGRTLGPGEGEQTAKGYRRTTSARETLFTTATSGGDSTPLAGLRRLSQASGPARARPLAPASAAHPSRIRPRRAPRFDWKRRAREAARLPWKASRRMRRCWGAAAARRPAHRAPPPYTRNSRPTFVWRSQRGGPGYRLRMPRELT